MVLTEEERMKGLIKEKSKSEPPKGDATTLSFIMKNQDKNLLANIVIPPPHAETKELTPKDYQMKEIILGNPTKETMKVLVTIGLKEVFKHMDQDE